MIGEVVNHVFYDPKHDRLIVGIAKKPNAIYIQHQEGHWLEVKLTDLIALEYIGEL